MANRTFWASLAATFVVLSPAISVAQDSPAKTDSATAAFTAFSVETTPIGTVIDTPEARAILDKYIPGLSDNPQIDMARGMTLRQAQGYAPDQVPEEALKKIEAEFGALRGK